MLTSMSLIIGSAGSPTVLKHRPKKREKVMTPRMFMLTAAAATLSGNMLRATSSNALRGVRCTALGRSAAVGAAAYTHQPTMIAAMIMIVMELMRITMTMPIMLMRTIMIVDISFSAHEEVGKCRACVAFSKAVCSE